MTFPESVGLVLTLANDDGITMSQAQLVYWMGGWADIDVVIRDEILTAAPEVPDLDSCIAVAESLVARMLA